MVQHMVEVSRAWREEFVRMIIELLWDAIKPRLIFYAINKELILTNGIQHVFRNGPHLNLHTRPTDCTLKNHKYIYNCLTIIELSQNVHEAEPQSYKINLTIVCHAGIEMIDGILVDSGVPRTCFERIEGFINYSPVNNCMLKLLMVRLCLYLELEHF